MNADRRLLTPIAGTIAAAVVVAAATFGGSLSNDTAAIKGDRFAIAGDSLCAGQAWPNLTDECLSWSRGDESMQPVRYVTLAAHDTGAGVTTLRRELQTGEIN